MSTKREEMILTNVITLAEGFDVEVDIDENQLQQISSFKQINSSFKNLQSMLTTITQPIADSLEELTQKVDVDSLKVGIGIKIGAEGNFILAKSNVGANLNIELIVKRKA
jgi:hypothetical protein